VPGEFLAVDVGGGCCAVAVDFHAVSCDVSLLFGQEFRVTWGVGKEEGGEDAEDDGDASFDEENEWPKFIS
jgi:hypothetical protein